MNTSLQARPRGLGVAGSLIGLLALIAVAISQWVLPAVLPGEPAHHVAVDTGHSLKERIMAKLKRVTPKKEETRSALGEWRHLLFNAAVSLGVLAIALAVLSLIRREEKLYAGVAVALGIGAIALQTAILFASLGAFVAILILYLVLNQPDGGFQIAVIGIGAIFLFAVIAGLASFQLAALVIGAAIVILIVLWFLSGF